MDKSQVEKVLDEIRPLLQADGGDIELVDFDAQEGVVKVKLTGGCAGCPMAQFTLKGYVEQTLKEKLSEIKKVENAS